MGFSLPSEETSVACSLNGRLWGRLVTVHLCPGSTVLYFSPLHTLPLNALLPSSVSLESSWEHAHLSKGEQQEAQGTASHSLPQPPLAHGKQAVEMFVTVTFSIVCFLVISSLYLLGNLRKLLQMY